MAEYDPMAGFRLPNPLEGITGPSSFGGNTSPNYMNFGYSNPTINPDVTAGIGSAGSGGGFLDGWSMTQQRNGDGSTWGGQGAAGLGILQGFGNAYMGMKQLGMAKDQLAFQKDTFNKNYAAQRQATNTGLQDRQAARVASNSGAYQSVGDYMNQNRIR